MKKNQIITEKHKQQISEAFKGKKRSDGDKLKISNAKIGIRTTFLTKESRNKISKSLKGAGSYNFGKHLSMETKTKISLALKNKRRKIILQS
jgi:hypothetical protein